MVTLIEHIFTLKIYSKCVNVYMVICYCALSSLIQEYGTASKKPPLIYIYAMLLYYMFFDGSEHVWIWFVVATISNASRVHSPQTYAHSRKNNIQKHEEECVKVSRILF